MNLLELFSQLQSIAVRSRRSAPELRQSLAERIDKRAAEQRECLSRTPELLVDISTLVVHDAGTGIQRVSRAILQQWLALAPDGYTVRPVHASRWHPYRYCDHYPNSEPLAQAQATHDFAPQAGDIFVSLDLTAHILPHHHSQLTRWKLCGVKVFFVVYDLLPTLYPEWFTQNGTLAQRNWLRSLAIYANGAMCISNSVARELNGWLDQTLGELATSVSVASFPLGADIDAPEPSAGGDESVDVAVAKIDMGNSVLMVGTIEPRKGHEAVVSAFELLWAAGSTTQLIIVGKAGWKVEPLVQRLRAHPEAGKRLHWFERATDGMLAALYARCAGLLMASMGEGYGLPIVEAARYRLPTLARDLPIFREIAGASATYFSAPATTDLAASLSAWLAALHQAKAVMPDTIELFSWQQSAAALWDRIAAVK